MEIETKKLTIRSSAIVEQNGAVIAISKIPALYDKDLVRESQVWQFLALDSERVQLREIMGRLSVEPRGSRQLAVQSATGERVLVELKWDYRLRVFLFTTYLLPAEVELTERQVEILAALADDLGYPEIARALGISESSVQTHVSNIRHKIGVQTTHGAIGQAYRLGVL